MNIYYKERDEEYYAYGRSLIGTLETTDINFVYCDFKCGIRQRQVSLACFFFKPRLSDTLAKPCLRLAQTSDHS